MKKKVWNLFVAVLLVITMSANLISTTVFAADLTASEITTQISTIYQKSKNSFGNSFDGYCGAYVAWQLFHMGINSSYVSRNGNETFDYYRNLSYSSGGYKITSYPSSSYTLKNALKTISQNGSKNVYNILVGLEKSNTSSGQTYGHAVFIHAIINGMVYFSESSTLSASSLGTFYEGSPISCTLDYFCDYIYMYTKDYAPKFDGVIHFEKGSSSSGSSVMTLSGLNYPIHKQSGYSFETFGVLSSQNIILVGEAVVYDSAWNQKFGIGTYEEHGRTTLNINNFDSYMAFASLPDGQYYYKIYAIDAKGYEIEKVFSFTVGPGSTTSGSTNITATHKHDTALDSRYTWDNGVITKQPTCTSAGKKLYTCNECKATKTSSISALGHSYSSSWTVDTEATCSSAGSKSQHCTRCDAKTNVTSIPASGHSYGDWALIREASCITTGSLKRTCSCGESEFSSISALGHNYVNGKCQRCGMTENASSTLTVESKSARIGDKITLDVVLENNPGILAMSLAPVYDESVLRLDTMKAGEGTWSNGFIGTSYVWVSTNGDSFDNGTVLTLEFTVLDTAPLADTTVSVIYDGSNTDEQTPAIDIISGTVSVVPDTVYGDVNGDGTVDTKDLSRLMRYLAGISVEVFSSDLNKDGKTTVHDLSRLMKIMAEA